MFGFSWPPLAIMVIWSSGILPNISVHTRPGKRKILDTLGGLHAPGVLHDLGCRDAMVGVWSEHALDKVPANVARAPRRLVLAGDDAREELLQPYEVVRAVVSALGKREHRCMHVHTSNSGTMPNQAQKYPIRQTATNTSLPRQAQNLGKSLTDCSTTDSTHITCTDTQRPMSLGSQAGQWCVSREGGNKNTTPNPALQ